MKKEVRQAILAGLILGLAAGAAWAEIQPIAMATLADGRVIELDGTNALYLINETGMGRHMPLGKVPMRLDAIDLEARGSFEDGLIFVAAWGKDAYSSEILRFSPKGDIQGRWPVPAAYPTGLAFDYGHRVLYISTLLDLTIVKLDLNMRGGTKPEPISQVSGATRLGPLAVDEGGGRLFVADPFSGTIYMIPLDTKKHVLFVSRVGEPSALAVAPGSTILYVADRAHRCIWAVPLNQAAPRPAPFWSSPALKEPLALTVKPDGTVLVGDATTKAIFKISRTGQLLSTIR